MRLGFFGFTITMVTQTQEPSGLEPVPRLLPGVLIDVGAHPGAKRIGGALLDFSALAMPTCSMVGDDVVVERAIAVHRRRQLARRLERQRPPDLRVSRQLAARSVERPQGNLARPAEAEVMGARLKTPEDPRPLTREECIVETVLGIVGGATVIEDGIERQIGLHDIHGVLYRLREAGLATQRFRARQSKPAMRAIQQLSTALRRANQPKGGLPEDIRLVLGLDRMIYHLAAYGKAHRKPKPDAIRKRLAADYALDLCERFGVKTTTARTGKFCLVAAALLGDPDVDLQIIV